MDADRAVPARDPPIQAETVYESDHTRVTRLLLPGRTVVRKEPLGLGWETRLRHELAILGRLRGVEGVAQLADVPPYPGSIMLDDVDGVCLANVPMPLERGELVSLAVELAQAVAGMHARGVMHTDIGPANIVLGGPHRFACLVDFALASSFAEIRPEFTHPSEIVGTLAYLAPELTGRTGRPVDQRADLYALGATLYELATGGPPFGSGDALRLTHDHVARVPVAPAKVNTAVPADLSEIIMHLLEKEPDSRYQTAEGLIYDLVQMRDGRSSPAVAPVRVGQHDVPLRLLPPSRLVGRDAEIAALGAAFAGATSGRCRGALVSGAPGVGKTSLIDELRPIVTGADGWFVTGKFDQYRRDQEFDAVFQAFRGLGRLLLAEPEDELTDLRQRMLRALGPNAGLAAASVPEFGVLLNVAPEPGDPLTTQVRAQRAAVEVLRAIASHKRPIVFVVDDLQWAGRTPLGFIDMVLGEEDLDGLLLVGAYRDDDVDATHPLTALVSRWRQRPSGPERIRLDNLPAASQAAMVADMLRLDTEDAAGLAQAIAPHTRGNPYDTVELLNALRHHGVLMSQAGRWRWASAALVRYLATSDIADVLVERTAAMPYTTRGMLQAVACLGGRVELSLLQAATGQPADTVEHWLEPALNDGLLVVETGVHEAVRFRHDRIRELILRRLAPERQHGLQLGMARRLATVPDLFAVAAQQYLPVIDAVRDADERRMVAELLRRAAEQATLLANHVEVEKLLAGALRLADPTQRSTLIELHTGRHAALYGLGRLDEADEEYAMVDRLCVSALERVDSTFVQVSSLINRNLSQQAVSLGVELLRQFGVPVPTPEALPAAIERGLDTLHWWLDHSDETDDLAKPENTDPTLLATAALIDRMLPAAYFTDPSMVTMGWLALEAVRILAEHGPSPTVIGPAGFVLFAVIGLRQDYRTGYRASRRILALGEARGYEPATSQARHLFANSSQWFEPLEDSVTQAQRAREGLIQAGDLANAGYSFQVTVSRLFDCTPTLDRYVEAVESAQAFARRTGNERLDALTEIYRRLVGVLRGEAGASAADDTVTSARYPTNQYVVVYVHIARALVAALFGDRAGLAEHTATAMRLLPALGITYATAVGYFLRGMALAGQARDSQGDERDALLSELDAVIDWLAARAADAPVNFLHLLRLVEAERARAVGDLSATLQAFDAAQREAATRQRPWHRALILERAAQFYLAEHMEHTGYALLAEARDEYQAWGATAKMDDLDWAYPALQPLPDEPAARDTDQSDRRDVRRRSTVMSGTINLLGVLSASQALSSETSIDGLRTRVVDVLSAMTGATNVHLLLYNDDRRDWMLSVRGSDSDDARYAGGVPIREAGRQHLVPMSVFRYAYRIREPLVVDDAVRDDRFARDPYFTDVECCALLAVPILNRGVLQALVLLENRLIHSAFSAERLDGVMLIAGQLAVSLNNAMVYASLERKVSERTDALALANARLEQLSVTDPLTAVANRRRLEDVLSTEWLRAQRSGNPLALAMIDIDHFKLYNDHYGHAAGDRCLQRVAHQLAATVRSTDLVARYGGEEFAVVMPGTDIAAGLESAEQLRAAIVALAEPHALAAGRIVTVSIGIAATTPSPDSNADGLIELADVELYRAKRSGRNKVRVARHGVLP